MSNLKKKPELDVEGINEVVSTSKKILSILYVVLIAGVIFIAIAVIKETNIHNILFTVLKVLSPLFIGFIIAWLFNPMVKKLQKRGLSRSLSSVIVFLSFIIIMVIFFAILIPTVYKQLDDIYSSVPSILDSCMNFINSILNNLGNSEFIDVEQLKANSLNAITNFTENITTDIPQMLFNGASNIISAIGTIGLGLGIGLYMLFDFDGVSSKLLKLTPKKYRYEVEVLIRNIDRELRNCVNGTLTIASMVFVCSSIGFWAIGLDAPILFGLFCGITDVIPYIGPWIGGIAALAVGFSQGFPTGILVLIIILIVQGVEGIILQPIVMGKSTNLHPVVIMIGLLVFGHFFGIVGMILATPILSLIKVLYRFICLKFNLFEHHDFPEYTDELIEE